EISVFLPLFFVLMGSNPALAMTVFYVDPDWSGTQDGTSVRPWTWLNSSAWATLNAALASDDVTVYFSARSAGSDTNQASTLPILISRADMSTHRLTLDGMSQYNMNDSAPSWSAYSGRSRFQITARYPIDSNNSAFPFPERNYVTIRGFRAIAIDGQVAS